MKSISRIIIHISYESVKIIDAVHDLLFGTKHTRKHRSSRSPYSSQWCDINSMDKQPWKNRSTSISFQIIQA